MTDTPEMPEMVPPAAYRAAGIRDQIRAVNEIETAYREGFTAGVLAERSRAPVEVTSGVCEACGGHYPNEECGHLKNARDLLLQPPCRPATPVDAAAIRRAAFEEAAQSLRARAVGWRRQRPGLGPIERSQVADCLEALAAALLLDPAAGWVGRDCPLGPRVKCNWKSCHGGACFLQNAASASPTQPAMPDEIAALQKIALSSTDDAEALRRMAMEALGWSEAPDAPPAQPVDDGWRCACGWSGVPAEMIANPSGCLCCPKCGASGGLEHSLPAPPAPETPDGK